MRTIYKQSKRKEAMKERSIKKHCGKRYVSVYWLVYHIPFTAKIHYINYLYIK